ncbi:D-lactate dehydrogenase [Sphingomonas sp.]|uniref:D-lactate dehydrogenase n=1 Tax=Sphingomonas sp. TaxID=28214 RepID=UPI002CAFE754|nr:D-lactate dehydrogenase [Sphingomonas sp.]HWK36352.1 D-lactate dehydrogenase [Sphingomonas sp.]
MTPAPAPTPTPARDPSSPPPADLVATLRALVGARHVLTGDATLPYRTGFRFGGGVVLAVARPGSLVELWRVAQAVVAAGGIIIMQASNTGLTGGSTPDGDGYDRPIVLVNTLRLAGTHVIRGGAQVVCLPGATLTDLETALKPLGREPHSVIGSSCIGASVFGGISNNSGGALIRRGPAFTELALYARLDEAGKLTLVNHLGIALGDEPEAMLARVEAGDFAEADIRADAGRASDDGYAAHVRDVAAATPARFNADAARLFEASGSAGKLILFAVRLDTFPAEAAPAVFYIGTNDPAELARLRRDVLASDLALPIAAEYLHRDAFVLTERYGKDTYLAVRRLGGARLPALFRFKAAVDLAARRIGLRDFSDRAMQAVSRLLPVRLPARLRAYRDRFAHHLMIKVSANDAAAFETMLRALLPSATGDWFRCTADEGDAAFTHRFAAAGAAVRYRTIHRRQVSDIVALDIALRRNDMDWFESLPAEIDGALLHKFYYGHFFCHVFHQDYIVRAGVDPLDIEHRMWALLDARGAEYPAEHNVGHLYPAKPALARFYRDLDPCNALNPGIGQTSKCRDWA